MNNKEEYLKTLTARRTVESLFRSRIAPKEQELNKDVCDFSKEDIEALYRGLHITAVGTLNVINTYLKQYTEWCLSNNLSTTNKNNFKEYNTDMLAGFLDTEKQKQNIITEEELLSLCKKINNVSDRFALQAIFEGIDVQELVYLKKSDIFIDENMERMGMSAILKSSQGKSRVVYISSELHSLAKMSAETNVYYNDDGSTRNLIGSDDIVVKDLSNKGDISGDYNDPYLAATRFRRLNDRIRRILNKLRTGLSAKDIRTSGMIHYINKYSKSLGITGESFLMSRHIDELNKQFGCDIVRTSFIRTYKSFFNSHELNNDAKAKMQRFKDDLLYSYSNETGFTQEFTMGKGSGMTTMAEISNLVLDDEEISIETNGGHMRIRACMFDKMVISTENGLTTYKAPIGDDSYEAYVFPFVRENMKVKASAIRGETF